MLVVSQSHFQMKKSIFFLMATFFLQQLAVGQGIGDNTFLPTAGGPERIQVISLEDNPFLAEHLTAGEQISYVALISPMSIVYGLGAVKDRLWVLQGHQQEIANLLSTENDFKRRKGVEILLEAIANPNADHGVELVFHWKDTLHQRLGIQGKVYKAATWEESAVPDRYFFVPGEGHSMPAVPYLAEERDSLMMGAIATIERTLETEQIFVLFEQAADISSMVRQKFTTLNLADNQGILLAGDPRVAAIMVTEEISKMAFLSLTATYLSWQAQQQQNLLFRGGPGREIVLPKLKFPQQPAKTPRIPTPEPPKPPSPSPEQAKKLQEWLQRAASAIKTIAKVWGDSVATAYEIRLEKKGPDDDVLVISSPTNPKNYVLVYPSPDQEGILRIANGNMHGDSVRTRTEHRPIAYWDLEGDAPSLLPNKVLLPMAPYLAPTDKEALVEWLMLPFTEQFGWSQIWYLVRVAEEGTTSPQSAKKAYPGYKVVRYILPASNQVDPLNEEESGHMKVFRTRIGYQAGLLEQGLRLALAKAEEGDTEAVATFLASARESAPGEVLDLLSRYSPDSKERRSLRYAAKRLILMREGLEKITIFLEGEGSDIRVLYEELQRQREILYKEELRTLKEELDQLKNRSQKLLDGIRRIQEKAKRGRASHEDITEAYRKMERILAISEGLEDARTALVGFQIWAEDMRGKIYSDDADDGHIANEKNEVSRLVQKDLQIAWLLLAKAPDGEIANKVQMAEGYFQNMLQFYHPRETISPETQKELRRSASAIATLHREVGKMETYLNKVQDRYYRLRGKKWQSMVTAFVGSYRLLRKFSSAYREIERIETLITGDLTDEQQGHWVQILQEIRTQRIQLLVDEEIFRISSEMTDRVPEVYRGELKKSIAQLLLKVSKGEIESPNGYGKSPFHFVERGTVEELLTKLPHLRTEGATPDAYKRFTGQLLALLGKQHSLDGLDQAHLIGLSVEISTRFDIHEGVAAIANPAEKK